MRAALHPCRGLLLLLVAALVLAAPARAADPSAIEKLTPEERKVLVSRVPDWEKLTGEQQEKIARSVLRLRELSPEDREKLVKRLGAIQAHRERHGRIPDGFRGRGRLVRAVGHQMWADLPKSVRASAKTHLGKRGRGGVEHAFFQRLWGLHAKKLAQGEIPLIAMPEGVPAQVKERVAEMRKQADAGDERARMRLAHFALALRTRKISAQLESGDEAAFAAVGRQIREQDVALFGQALADLETASQSKEALERYVRRGRFGGKGMRGRDPRLERLRGALKEAWPILEKDPRLLEAARRLRQALESKGHGRGAMRRGGRPQRGPQRGPATGPQRGGK